jgi:hypothetical protein
MTFKAPLAQVLNGDVIRELTVSPNDQHVLARCHEHLVYIVPN